MNITGLVLAAGAGRRFGAPKALAEINGERFVDRAVRVLHDGGCASVWVVAGAAPVTNVAATVIDNPKWRQGMGSSLRVGLAQLAAGSGIHAAVVMPVDALWLSSIAVQRVIDAYRQGALVAAASYAGVRGHPVLLASCWWSEVSSYAVGELGARGFLDHYRDSLTLVDCDDAGSPRDVDHPNDLS